MNTSNLRIGSLTRAFKDGSIWKQIDWLWFAIIVGTLFRLCYPFYFHPLDHLYSDNLRHYLNAGSRFNNSIDSFLDPPLPQFWLKSMLFLFTDTRLGISLYFGLLCAVTPWIWYLWGRLLFPSEKKAKIFLASLVFLPQWLAIYGFFMDETLLLPILGLALWLSWKAQKDNSAQSFLIAIVAWAFALCIKLNVLPLLLIVFTWLSFNFLQRHSNKMRSWVTVGASALILLLSYLTFPLWVYQGLGTTWLYPAGMGMLTRAYYHSGATSHSATVVSDDHSNWHVGPFACNAMLVETFAPFSDWKTWRRGTFDLLIDCRQKPFTSPKIPILTMEKRIVCITESALYFFFSHSWPEEVVTDLVNAAQVETRWMWGFLTFFIVGLAWQKKRFKDIIVVLCLGSALLYIFNDSAPMEGRYRKPWEGIALAAFIFLFNAPVAKPAIDMGKSS